MRRKVASNCPKSIGLVGENLKFRQVGFHGSGKFVVLAERNDQFCQYRGHPLPSLVTNVAVPLSTIARITRELSGWLGISWDPLHFSLPFCDTRSGQFTGWGVGLLS